MTPKIPFNNLSQQYLKIKDEIDKVVLDVCASGNYILGPNVRAFEKELAFYCDCKYSVGVASGTDALLLSLMSIGINAGDEVITTPFTFIATANTVTRLGAKPVFVDICPDTYNIDPAKIESSITSRTKAIIPVHLFGNPANMAEISAIANSHGLAIIEDAAQAIGAKFDGKSVGGFGKTGALSFFPSKNLGAYGDGGAVLTNEENIRQQLDLLRRQGAKRKYYHEVLGTNSRLDEIQAAILRVKLRHLDIWIGNRREIAKYYYDALQGTEFILPIEHSNVYHVYHHYSIRIPKGRDEFYKYMLDKGIETMIYYPYPLHLQPLFEYLGHKISDFPVSEEVSKQIISLPCYPELTSEELEQICNAIYTFRRSL
jgi:dTDP-4-amino-4,6-dideoxygalactose transaminase